MKHSLIILAVALFAFTFCQAQDTCRLADGTYWACADLGRLVHVYPESTVVAQTMAAGSMLTAVHFDKACERYGWAGGVNPQGQAIILRTIDGGKNWAPVILPCLPPDKDNRPVRIHTYKALIVMVLLANGTQLRSHDAGCSFDQLMRPVEGYGIEEARKRFE